MLNLGAIPWTLARRDPAAAVVSVEGRTLSADELDRASASCAALLGGAGMKPGDRAALLCGNGLAFPVAYYGALRAGAVVAPLSTAAPPAALGAGLRRVRARVLVTDGAQVESGVAAAAAAATGCSVVTLDETGGSPRRRRAAALASLVDGRSTDPVMVPAGTPAVILATSGTTGVPRGAVHSHAGLLLNARAVATEILDLRPGDRQLGILPLAHSFGMSAVLNASLLAGAAVVLVRRPDPVEALRVLEEQRITVLQAVPTVLGRLAAAAGPRPGSLRRVVVSGAPLPAHLARAVHDRLCDDLVERYGMTECSPVTVRRVDRDGGVPGDVGAPLSLVCVRVAGGDRVGELEVAAPTMFLRYDRDPRGTAAALTGGFLRTGDIGSIGPGGRVRLQGRLKEVIVRGGNNVAAREVEAVLEAHPAVLEAAVLGVPDRDLGEEVAAAVVLRGRGHARTEELQAHCARLLASYMVPRRWATVGALPRTATGKVIRHELLQLFDAGPAAGILAYPARRRPTTPDQ